MPFDVPQLDRRTYRQLLNETLARVSVHNPEYTHLNDSDPGVTLMQLFAFLGESILYRANRIPERNHRTFLRLLGQPLRPARAARGLVTFSRPKGTLEALTLKPETAILAGEVPFRTLHGLDLLPIEGRIYTKRRLTQQRQPEALATFKRLYASLEEPDTELEFYETVPFEPPNTGFETASLDLADTVDGTFWLALLAREGDDPEAVRHLLAGRVLTLGFLPALDEQALVLAAGGVDALRQSPSWVVERPDTSTREARYRRLELRTSSDLLSQPGVGEVVLPAASDLRFWNDLGPIDAGTGFYPPSLEETDGGPRLITWLRLRLDNSDKSQQGVRLSWLGINAAEAVQAARVVAERLPLGTGEPDQQATLAHTPVLAESLELTVGGERWRRIDDLVAAAPEVPPRIDRGSASSILASPPDLLRDPAEGPPPEAKVFAFDPEAGTLRFGDGARGARPPRGAEILASYTWGGGRQGMIGIGAIKKAPDLPNGVKVTNPVAFWGGDEAETVAEAERRIPAFLKNRDRLISAEDFVEVTLGTPGVDLGRVEVLPLFHPDLEEGTATGVVTVLVIPRHDPLQPETPSPDRLFLQTVADHLEDRRLITTEIRVHGPDYQPVWISLGLEVVPGRAKAPVRQAVEQALRRFLSPLVGGFEERGWPLRTPLIRNDLAAAAARVDGVQRVDQVLLGNATGGDDVDTVPLSGLQLPRIVSLAVQVGEATPLDALRGQGEIQDSAAPRRVPVPVELGDC